MALFKISCKIKFCQLNINVDYDLAPSEPTMCS
jgi:hypothetical protein